jgi:hypothetical protein
MIINDFVALDSTRRHGHRTVGSDLEAPAALKTKKAGKKPAFFVVPRDVRIRCDQYRATAGPPQR